MWSFFTRRQNNNAECNYCKKTLKIVNNGTSSMLRHVKRKHAAEFGRSIGLLENQLQSGFTIVNNNNRKSQMAKKRVKKMFNYWYAKKYFFNDIYDN